MRALLDVSVLLALFDPNHSHHQRAHFWWVGHRNRGWASCPLTQNGFLRIISKPGYPNPLPLPRAVSLWQAQVALPGHHFWPDDISVADAKVFDHRSILGPSQITDVYLLGLAVRKGGCLVTFDRAIPNKAVRGAEARHVVVL